MPVRILYALVLATVAAAPAACQTPTFSLEATDVNGLPLEGGSVSRIHVNPGDTITAAIFIRDWSANGEKLRSYQATLDAASFASGDSGSIQPIDLGIPENTANAFIDESDPRYVHKGMHTIPIVDTSTDMYRWLDVLFDEKESPVSRQDGKKYYCGTVRLAVSPDAAGAFELRFSDQPELTLIVDPANVVIPNLQLEPLTVEVAAAAKWLRIQRSEPSTGAIDARVAASDHCAWNSIRLSSTGDAASVKPEDFLVQDGSDQPPIITGLRTNGSTVELSLNRGISPLSWTQITHKPSGTFTRIACLPGDVNNDGVRNGGDLMALVETLNGPSKRPIYQIDINADGAISAGDLGKLVDVLEAARRENQLRISDR